MNTTLVFHIQPSTFDAARFLAEARSWLTVLGSGHPDFAEWWIPPRGPNDAFVPLRDHAEVIARVGADRDRLDAEYGANEGVRPSAIGNIVLTNAGNEREWNQKGKVALYVNLGLGQLRLSISKLETTYADPGAVLWRLLARMAEDCRVRFAQVNVRQKIGVDLLLYSRDRAPFPHREFLGWMGYVDAPLTEHQIPAAARLERCGNGTLILATDVLDLSDPHAVQQANQVEMSLVDLGLLPVIDPALK
ncbi:Imm52 family immunity protein [Stenotrophomonas maltophilia]|uniref:Imm52 family immunity protein n=1 Tax=Stenotrophomonas maltophilia TaxID=40324 RepID=UPI002893D875|nr:Imm52 family immunity protein [Stenotrophomonas maltophilia]MDT3500622.1 Imm52 family immunity protein [Stenotrophomonas maltophilia]